MYIEIYFIFSDDLQRELRKCFRKVTDQKKRQRQFFHWNYLLESACNQSNHVITQKLYHGVNKPLMPSSFAGTYYGPISTTTMFDIAKQFAGSNGRILELYPSFSKRGLRVSWLSNFPDEDEVLYMNASFQIVNIYSNSKQNIYSSPFDPIISSHTIYEYYTDSEDSTMSNSSSTRPIKDSQIKKLKERLPQQQQQQNNKNNIEKKNHDGSSDDDDETEQKQQSLIKPPVFPLRQISEDRYSVQFFEKSIMKAIQMININSYIISFNCTEINQDHLDHLVRDGVEENKYDAFDPEIDFLESGFSRLKANEQVSVLYLLYLQYKKREWHEFVNATPDYVNMAIARYRDQFMQLAKNVQAVKMERASRVIQQFFAKVHTEDYEFPAKSRRSQEKSDIKKMWKILRGDSSEKDIKYIVHLPTFCKIFPNCEQILINGNNFDWSLDEMINFLSQYNLNYSRIGLKDIYIRFVDPKNPYDNIDYSEKMAKHKTKYLSPKKLDELLKLGWQFVGGTRCHLHRYGFQPHPEIPFLGLFAAKDNQEILYSGYTDAIRAKRPHNKWAMKDVFNQSNSSLISSRTTSKLAFFNLGRGNRKSSSKTAYTVKSNRSDRSIFESKKSRGSTSFTTRTSTKSITNKSKSKSKLLDPPAPMHAEKSSESEFNYSEGGLGREMQREIRMRELGWSRTSSANRSQTRFKSQIEGSDVIIVPHNSKVCNLSSICYYKHDKLHQQQLELLLYWRKDPDIHRIESQTIRMKQPLFAKLCRKVEQLVIDPLPVELERIFIDKENKRPIISFDTIIKIFPNVKDIFLRDTRFSLRIWYNLLKSIEKYNSEQKKDDDNINEYSTTQTMSLSKSASINSLGPGAPINCRLTRIFFSKKWVFNHMQLKTMDLRFKPHGWKFQPKEQVLFKVKQI